MDHDTLTQLIEQRYSARAIARREGVSPTKVRYWLKKYGLRVNVSKGLQGRDRRCGKCGETDPAKFYGHKKRICAVCHSKYTLESGREKKLRAVQELGGACIICGYNQYTCSLCFHHLNPIQKDPTFNTMRYWGWERVLKEIKKCILVCQNCHAAIHAGHIKIGV